MTESAEVRTATLIVEDNPLFRTLIASLLRSHFPWVHLLEADGVHKGLAEARRHEPVLVVMDIRLPDGNGLDAARTISRELPGTTIIVCTSYDLPEYRQAGLECGAAGYLAKDSLDPRQFVALAEKALGTGPDEASHPTPS